MAQLRFDFLVGNTFGRLAGLNALSEHVDKSIPEMEWQVQHALKTRAESEGWDYSDYDVQRQNLPKRGQVRSWLLTYGVRSTTWG